MLVVEGRALVKGEVKQCCIGIEKGRIVDIQKVLHGDQHLKFGDHLILPGAVDPHVHFREPGMTDKEDIASGSLAALHGGVTCALDMPNTKPATTSLEEMRNKKQIINKRSWIDMGVFAGVCAGKDPAPLAEEATAFKIFMGSSTGDLLLKGEAQLKYALQQIASTGKVVSVHAEEESMLEKGAEDLIEHERCRPASAEWAAVDRLQSSSQDAKINICHVTSRHTPPRIQPRCTWEVTTHHMLLDYDDKLEAFGKVNPPLRSRADRTALFQLFAAGKVPMLGSDHAPHTFGEKSRSFDEAPSGMPGVETSVPLMLALVKKNLLSLQTLMRACAETPAQVFGLNKGLIEIGRDADLMIVDPSQVKVVKARDMRSKCGWTAYEGKEALFPHAVMVRGQLMMENGSLVGERGGRCV
jgi:dihydroorotase